MELDGVSDEKEPQFSFFTPYRGNNQGKNTSRFTESRVGSILSRKDKTTADDSYQGRFRSDQRHAKQSRLMRDLTDDHYPQPLDMRYKTNTTSKCSTRSQSGSVEALMDAKKLHQMQTDLDNAREDVCEYKIANTNLQQQLDELRQIYENQSKKMMEVCQEKRELIAQVKVQTNHEMSDTSRDSDTNTSFKRTTQSDLSSSHFTKEQNARRLDAYDKLIKVVSQKGNNMKNDLVSDTRLTLAAKCKSHADLNEQFCFNANEMDQAMKMHEGTYSDLCEYHRYLDMKADALEKQESRLKRDGNTIANNAVAKYSDLKQKQVEESAYKMSISLMCRSIVHRCVDDAVTVSFQREWTKERNMLSNELNRALGRCALTHEQSKQIRRLKQELSDERMRNQNLQQECAKLRLISATECTFLESENKLLKEEIENLSWDKQKLEENLLDTAEIIASLKNDIRAERQHKSQIHSQLQMVSEKKNLLEIRLNECKLRLSNHMEQIKDMSDKLGGFQMNTHNLESELNRLRHHNVTLHRENDQLKEQNREIHQLLLTEKRKTLFESEFEPTSSFSSVKVKKQESVVASDENDDDLSVIESQKLEIDLLQKDINDLMDELDESRQGRIELREYLKQHHNEAQQKLQKLHQQFLFMRNLALSSCKSMISQSDYISRNPLLKKQLDFLQRQLDQFADQNHTRGSSFSSPSSDRSTIISHE